ncbi:MAG TPA: NAD(P)/FAD-dependent oxidoreductase [Acidimicrobiales bacterium]|nr:NAD(P)/FAD-dependent oxidoreductase [Acidimicrobiales bacterium]
MNDHSPPAYDAIIVGAGHNGLVTSFYLARAGMKVLVLESRDIIGGAAVTEELWPGHRVPTCSYLCHVLQAKVIEDMDLPAHGFSVHHLEPGYFAPFPDGSRILTWDDDDRTVAEISKISRHDAAAFPHYIALRKRMASLIAAYFLKPAPSLAEMVEKVRHTEDEPLLERLLVGSMTDLLDEYFVDSRVKGWQVSALDAGDPSAPGSLLSASYVAVGLLTPTRYHGIVSGGMGGITQAMAGACRSMGVDLRINARVERILVESEAAVGVRLENGDELMARIIVSNADPKLTFLELVGKENLQASFVEAVERLKTKAAYLKFHAVASDLPDFSRYLGPGYDDHALAQIRICPSVEYYRQSWDDASHGRLSTCPVMSIQIPTVYDSTLVQGEGHVISIWVQYAPVKPANGHWNELSCTAGEQLIDAVSEYVPDFRSKVTEWVLFTPDDIERRVGMTDGNIRHIDMVAGQLLNLRPMAGWSNYRTPVEGLYLCGAGTHPGGEVTGAPGHNAAYAILKDRLRSVSS